jgi:hypothetical protein
MSPELAEINMISTIDRVRTSHHFGRCRVGAG